MLLMRNLIIILVLLMGVSMHSQDTINKWTLGLEYGNHYLNDRSAQNTQEFGKSFTHAAINTRYNFNRTFGLGARLSYGYLKMLSHDDVYVNEGFTRFNIEAVVDVFDVVGLDKVTDQWNMLTYFGPGVGWFQGETVANLYGGVSVMKRLSNKTSLKLSYGLTGNINQKRTLDNRFKSTAEGITSQLHTVALGIDFHLKVKDKVPADYYVPPFKTIVIHYSDTTIVNNHYHKTKIIKEIYEPSYLEYVFFDHDKSKVRKSELNAIYQIYTAHANDPFKKIIINGWASPTSSTDDYNLKLSARRCKALKRKFMDMGVSEGSIEVNPHGKDFHLDPENVHDLARRVTLQVN